VQAELQQQNQKLDSAVKELETLRAEVQQRNDQEERQAELTEAQRAAAVTLGDVEQQLITGNSEVGGMLASVEGSLGPAARANVQQAREALANSDLTSARYYLARAAIDVQAGR
jgi:hypothetical protein